MKPNFEKGHLEELEVRIKNAKRMVIVSHQNADGDAVGSLLGAYHIISNHFGGEKHIDLVLPNGCPRTFRHLPGAETIMSGDEQREACQKVFDEADLILGTDFNNAPRLLDLAEMLTGAKGYKILIDHHHGPDREAFDLVFSDPDMSSASELVYWTFAAMWGNDCTNCEAAQCLYNGICTDTGSFSFSNEDPSVYEAAAELVKHPIGAAELHNKIDNTFSIERMRFWGHAIDHLLIIDREKRFAYFRIPLAEMERYGISSADLEGLVGYTLKMEEIEVGALIREEVGRVKLSLRSKYDVDVNLLARQYFGGGGHTKAAGATCNQMTLEEVEEQLKQAIARL